MEIPKQFIWGAASAAYQVEGAYLSDGKVPGIWDALSEGHIRHNENGNTACDHYHRFREDVALMKEMGIRSYRFSVSWPRVMSGPETVNEEGLSFYRELVSELKKAQITPMVTLYHWNLPLWAHEKGGWLNPEIVKDFSFYCRVVVDALSDEVDWWMTLNEPACFVTLGYQRGVHAPFERTPKGEDEPERLRLLSRHVLLAHGEAVRIIRERAKKKPRIGMALNGDIYLPEGETGQERERARARSFPDEPGSFSVSWWADPVFLKKLPKPLQGILTKEELSLVGADLDFFGFNCYNAVNFWDEEGKGNDAVYPGMPRTAMDWPITPDVLYWAAVFLFERYKKPILITENGMANLDFVMSDGKVHDPQRIEYMKGYISGLLRAAKEGCPVLGYLYWSIFDNFEWAEGYDRRFGLVYVDYQSQRRIRKDSSYWYESLIRRGEL